MPEFFAPGIYVEELPSSPPSIRGHNATAAAFIGPTRFGPVNSVPQLLTSLTDFERTYGDGQPLEFASLGGDPAASENYMWHAARAFFANGGQRLYVARVFRPSATINSPPDSRDADVRHDQADDGHAKAVLRTLRGGVLRLRARYPGAAGNVRVRLSPSHAGVSSQGQELARRSDFITITIDSADGTEQTWTKVSRQVEPAEDSREVESLPTGYATQESPVVVTCDAGSDSLVGLLRELIEAQGAAREEGQADRRRDAAAPEGVFVNVQLEGGDDGARPGAAEYEGRPASDGLGASGLQAFEELEDIATLAAPGSTRGLENEGYQPEARKIIRLLIDNAERRRPRFALLDCGDDQSFEQVRAMRAGLAATRDAALYYPWLRVSDSQTNRLLSLPPSGFVAGIIARVDVTRGIFKAPVNEQAQLAVGLDTALSRDQMNVLNSEGVNVIRELPGRGPVVWGARTLSPESEWKYVNVRRYLAYLEHSIDRGTQWVVFEPNDEPLWVKARGAVKNFLLAEWRAGGLMGVKPEEAFFVKCDRTTMTQDDIDSGRLVVLVGVAPIKPAEFVVFRVNLSTSGGDDD